MDAADPRFEAARHAPHDLGAVLRRYSVLVLRRWQIVVASTAFTTGLVVFWLSQTQPIYTSSAQVLMDPRKERVLRTEAVVGELLLDANSVATEVALIQSFAVAKRVVELLRLDEQIVSTDDGVSKDGLHFRLTAWMQKIYSDLFSSPSSGEPSVGEVVPTEASAVIQQNTLSAIARLQSGISARRVATTYLIDIHYSHSSPVVAAKLANAIAEAYLAEQREAKVLVARRAATWLNEQVVTLRVQLAASERAVAEHRAKHGLTSPKLGTAFATVAVQQAVEINAQLAAARAQAVEKKAKYEQVQRILEGGGATASFGALIDSPMLTLLRQQDADLARAEADQITRLGPGHPSSIKIRAERADIGQQTNREIHRLAITLKTDYEFALKREESLSVSLRELTSDEMRNDQAVIRLRELEREAQSNIVMFESLLARLKDIEQQASLHVLETRIVAPAFVPGSPSYPNTNRFLLLGVVGGMALGFGVIFASDHLKRGFTTSEQVELALQLPLLAMVPNLTRSERLVGGRVVSVPEYVVENPLSRFSESVRSVRLRTGRTVRSGRPPGLILVTSAVPAEGKTAMTLSLAYSAAASKQRVLVVEADLRRPSISAELRLTNQQGLADVLMDHVRPEQVLERGRAFTVLPAGKTTPHAADLLGTERLSLLLEQFRGSFDVVYIDAPPLTPVVDSILLAKLVDAIVLVVEWRATPRVIVDRALRSIEQQATKVAGIVLNKTQLKHWASYELSGDYLYGKSEEYYLRGSRVPPLSTRC